MKCPLGQKLREITAGLRVPEGPVALANGFVPLVEIERRALTRVFADGNKRIVANMGGGPNGTAIGPDGKCYICINGG
jgi:gluconolactonase